MKGVGTAGTTVRENIKTSVGASKSTTNADGPMPAGHSKHFLKVFDLRFSQNSDRGADSEGQES